MTIDLIVITGVVGKLRVDKFLNDLSKSVTHVRTNPKKSSGIAPVYGMANSLPFNGIIQDLLKK